MVWLSRLGDLTLLSPARLFVEECHMNLVLVHGAFVDGSGWEDVYKLLLY